ncbi:MAG: fibronectin type III domain-containing protein [Acidimicrobiales bacterium]
MLKRRQWVAVLGVFLLVAGLTVATLTGTRERAAALQLLQGDAWLANKVTGTVTHVNGYAKRTDPPVPVSSPGDPFTVVQRPDGAYMLDTRTGRLTRVGDDTLGVTGFRQVPGQSSALRVNSSGSVTWVIDASSGVLQQLNPGSLTPVGVQIPLGGLVGSAVSDASGTLWAALPDKGVVDQVSPADGAIHQIPVGQPGDRLQLVVTANGTWAIDPQAGEVLSLSDPSLPPVRVGQVALSAPPPVVASAPASPDLVVVSGTTLTDIQTPSGTSSSLSHASYGAATQAVIANDQVYLLDAGSHQLDLVGLNPLHPIGPVAVPPGSDQLVAHDNLVFVNNDGSPSAAVVDASGHVTDIAKYQVARAPAAPGAPAGNAARGPLGPPVPGPALAGAPLGLPATVAPLLPSPPVASPPAASPPAATPTPAPVVAAPTTTLPSAPGAPSVLGVTAGPGTLGVRWQAGSGTPPTGYVVLVTPQAGGSTIKATAAAGSSQITVPGLARGVAYCAQVQATGAGGGSALSAVNPAKDCTATTPNAPTARPSQLSFVPGFNVVDLTFAAGAGDPAGTTYTVAVNGAAVKTGVAPGTRPISVPVPAGKTFTTATVTVSGTDAGGTGPAASLAAWSYWVGSNEGCTNAGGNWYTLGAGLACPRVVTPHLTYEDTPEDSSTLLPVDAADGEETMCHAGSPATVAIYLVSAPGQTTCPAPPPGFGSPVVGNVVWSKAGSTHTSLVQEWQGTEANGTVEYVFVAPGETLNAIAGQTLTNVSVYASWYNDPG